jgi:hypothetical protein
VRFPDERYGHHRWSLDTSVLARFFEPAQRDHEEQRSVSRSAQMDSKL